MKNQTGTCCAIGLLFALTGACTAPRPSPPYINSTIESEIRQIRAIDNHAHPVAVPTAGKEDRDFDALPADAIEDPALPAPMSEGNPFLPEAWHGLFGYNFSDTKPEHAAQVQQARSALKKQKGDLYPSWVLNQTNTDIMLANRVAMGRGLPTDRFKWVPFADPFLFPLNNNTIKAVDPEHRAFMTSEEELLKESLAAGELDQLPPTLDEYLAFVTHRIEVWKASGAVAIKFELAYLRDLQIGNPPKETVDRVYSLYSRASEPGADGYRMLQDFIFRHISKEAGRLGMPIHIHSSIGAGSYFRDANAQPFAMESLINDPALRKTMFVMLHGAWPFTREAAVLILKPNVYVDFSAFGYLTYPVEAARSIRLYLEAAPQKVLYGSDASPFSNLIGWEDTAWIGAERGRVALGLALTGMLHDGEITSDRAKQLAHMVLRENARQLYRF